jgi:3'-phosphoadenosine 5'-phosphosulfate (PAPS) 3'-phosphatase
MAVRLDLQKLLLTCVRSSLGAQQYVLSDMLQLSSLLRERPGDVPPHPRSGHPTAEHGERIVDAPLSREAAVNNSSGDIFPHSSSCDDDDDGGRREAVRRSIMKSLDIDVKGDLSHKGGAAAKDLVTSADVLVQKIVMAALRRAFAQPPSLNDANDVGDESSQGSVSPRLLPTSASSVGTLPFRFVGEEDGDGCAPDDEDPLAASLSEMRSTAWTPPAEEQQALAERRTLRTAICTYGDAALVPHEALLRKFLAEDAGAARFVDGGSMAELQQRVSVFVDPIDGTNAFVEGVLEVPMNLIGIAVDGVPVAAVVNKIFVGGPSSLSYCFRRTDGGAPPSGGFVVVDGEYHGTWQRSPPAPPHQLTRRLAVTYSETTKATVMAKYLEMLGAMERVPARGAGYKLMSLVCAHLGTAPPRNDEQQEGGSSGRRLRADVFVCPPNSVKKWDTCAAHAFLLLMGGDIFDLNGLPVRYNLLTPSASRLVRESQEKQPSSSSSSAGAHGEDPVKLRNTSLPDGVVAVNGLRFASDDDKTPVSTLDIVKERLEW